MDNPGLIIGLVFLSAAAVGTVYLAYGSPKNDRLSNYSDLYGRHRHTSRRHGGKLTKTKRKK